jgi:hypothetical protein
VYVWVLVGHSRWEQRRFRGASPVYPTPRNREIGFYCLRFRFVRAVRGLRGEAKLRGRMWDVVLIAGPRGCWDPSVCVSVAVLLASIFCAQVRGFLLIW